MTGKGWRRTRKGPGREKQSERVGEGVGEEEGLRGVRVGEEETTKEEKEEGGGGDVYLSIPTQKKNQS